MIMRPRVIRLDCDLLFCVCYSKNSRERRPRKAELKRLVIHLHAVISSIGTAKHTPTRALIAWRQCHAPVAVSGAVNCGSSNPPVITGAHTTLCLHVQDPIIGNIKPRMSFQISSKYRMSISVLLRRCEVQDKISHCLQCLCF